MTVTFYIDPLQSGVSGNMLLGALIDAGGSEKKFRDIVKKIEKEADCKIKVKKEKVKNRGISSLFVDIETDGRCEDLTGILKKVLRKKAEREVALRVAETILDAEEEIRTIFTDKFEQKMADLKGEWDEGFLKGDSGPDSFSRV